MTGDTDAAVTSGAGRNATADCSWSGRRAATDGGGTVISGAAERGALTGVASTARCFAGVPLITVAGYRISRRSIWIPFVASSALLPIRVVSSVPAAVPSVPDPILPKPWRWVDSGPIGPYLMRRGGRSLPVAGAGSSPVAGADPGGTAASPGTRRTAPGPTLPSAGCHNSGNLTGQALSAFGCHVVSTCLLFSGSIPCREVSAGTAEARSPAGVMERPSVAAKSTAAAKERSRSPPATKSASANGWFLAAAGWPPATAARAPVAIDQAPAGSSTESKTAEAPGGASTNVRSGATGTSSDRADMAVIPACS